MKQKITSILVIVVGWEFELALHLYELHIPVLGGNRCDQKESCGEVSFVHDSCMCVCNMTLHTCTCVFSARSFPLSLVEDYSALFIADTAKTDWCMSLEMDNGALVFQKTSALLLVSGDMHKSVFAVDNQSTSLDL